MVVLTGGGCEPSSLVVATWVKMVWPTGAFAVPPFVGVIFPVTVLVVVAANAGIAATPATIIAAPSSANLRIHHSSLCGLKNPGTRTAVVRTAGKAGDRPQAE